MINRMNQYMWLLAKMGRCLGRRIKFVQTTTVVDIVATYVEVYRTPQSYISIDSLKLPDSATENKIEVSECKTQYFISEETKAGTCCKLEQCRILISPFSFLGTKYEEKK